MTGQGGWPLNVFLTPEQVPFFAGTYFPPDSRMGMPSWRSVLDAVAKAWDDRREEIRAGGEQIAARLQGGALLSPSEQPFDEGALDSAVEVLRGIYDRAQGGFGRAPKFPPASTIEFLLRRGETEMSVARRCARWRPGGCTTRWAAVSRATRWTPTGSSPTSRRCSTTTRCSRARTCTAGR